MTVTESHPAVLHRERSSRSRRGRAPAGEVGQADPAASAGHVTGSLSPSRANDFTTCPLRYRFRVIDRLPERPSPAAARGTVVHAVLEELFALPRGERTLERACALVAPAWERLLAEDPDLAGMFGPDDGGAEPAVPGPGGRPAPTLEDWLASASDLLSGYFTLEDPNRLEPAARELYVEHVLPTGLRLRGYLDRLDEADGGLLRVVDYKTGRSPGAGFESSALFQMKFYALVLWRVRGIVPRELVLLYLGDRVALRYQPDEASLRGFERVLTALWAAIERATATGDFRARPSRLCDWCDHQAICPAFGGTPPPMPSPERALPLLDAGPEPVCEAVG